MYNTKKGLITRKSKEWNQFIKNKTVQAHNENSILGQFNSQSKKYGVVLVDDEPYIYDNNKFDKSKICNLCIDLLSVCAIPGERLLLFDILVTLKYSNVVNLLIEEFYACDYDRWAIGDLLYRSADISHCTHYLAISNNKIYGTARQMVVLIFGKLHYSPALESLIQLLDDEDVYGHALSSLSKIANQDYIQYFYRFIKCDISWIRKISVNFVRKYVKIMSNKDSCDDSIQEQNVIKIENHS